MIITEDLIITDEKEIKTVNKSKSNRTIIVTFKDNSEVIFEANNCNENFKAIKKAIEGK